MWNCLVLHGFSFLMAMQHYLPAVMVDETVFEHYLLPVMVDDTVFEHLLSHQVCEDRHSIGFHTSLRLLFDVTQ